jgi:hypothetical protein
VPKHNWMTQLVEAAQKTGPPAIIVLALVLAIACVLSHVATALVWALVALLLVVGVLLLLAKWCR